MAEPTVGSLIADALGAYDALVEVAEAVEDEAQYVADLSSVWRGRLGAVAAASADALAAPETVAAVAAASAEIRLVEDPHQAIDWLSTFPQVVLLALGEAP